MLCFCFDLILGDSEHPMQASSLNRKQKHYNITEQGNSDGVKSSGIQSSIHCTKWKESKLFVTFKSITERSRSNQYVLCTTTSSLLTVKDLATLLLKKLCDSSLLDQN